MYWQEQDDNKASFQVSNEVFDLLFELNGKSILVDHAYLLAQEVIKNISSQAKEHIAIHQIRVAESGNGWSRPDQLDDLIHLSKRTKLIIRVHKDAHQALLKLEGQTLNIGDQALIVGKCKVRKLSRLTTIFSHGIVCDEDQSENEFLTTVVHELEQQRIFVKKMICGSSRLIRSNGVPLFTRSLMIANLTPEDSVLLQQQGLGTDRLLGCGIFVPHKGIEAVYSKPE
jgi:CRISPR-associated protein Cas6